MFLALFLLILLGIDWASGYAIAGFVMHHGVSPYGYAFWQSFGPLLCLFIIQLYRKDILPAKNSLIYSVGCGLFGIAIPNLLVYLASQRVSSGMLTVIANCAPIFTYPLALFFHKEKFNIIRLFIVLLGSIGIIILVAPVNINLEFNFTSYWLYIALLIPLCYAFSVVYIARFLPKNGNVLNYSMWMLLISAMFNTPLTFAHKGFYLLNIHDLNSWLIILEILLSAIGYVLLFIILKLVGPVYYTLVNAIAAIMGLIYGWLLFAQGFNLVTYFACMLIIGAIVGLTYTQRKLYNEV